MPVGVPTVSATNFLCPKCRKALVPPTAPGPGASQCPRCSTIFEYEVLPALLAGPRVGIPGEALVDASEASCFFHAEKRAAIACESCGRFLCSLCDLELDGRHICPSCFSSGRKKGTLANLDQFRISWPGLALLSVLVLPLGFYPFTPIFAACALVFLGIAWRKPGSVTGRRRIFICLLATVLAVGELIGSAYLGRALIRNFTSGSAAP